MGLSSGTCFGLGYMVGLRAFVWTFRRGIANAGMNYNFGIVQL